MYGNGVSFLAAFKQIHLKGGQSVVKELFSFSACKICVMHRKKQISSYEYDSCAAPRVFSGFTVFGLRGSC